jgi:hypothetical protein
MPIARLSGRIDLAASAIIRPAGAMPINPNNKTETIKDIEKHNNKRESIANPMQK